MIWEMPALSRIRCIRVTAGGRRSVFLSSQGVSAHPCLSSGSVRSQRNHQSGHRSGAQPHQYGSYKMVCSRAQTLQHRQLFSFRWSALQHSQFLKSAVKMTFGRQFSSSMAGAETVRSSGVCPASA